MIRDKASSSRERRAHRVEPGRGRPRGHLGGGGSRAAVARCASAESADVKRVRFCCGGTGDVGDVGEGGAFCIVSGCFP